MHVRGADYQSAGAGDFLSTQSPGSVLFFLHSSVLRYNDRVRATQFR